MAGADLSVIMRFGTTCLRHSSLFRLVCWSIRVSLLPFQLMLYKSHMFQRYLSSYLSPESGVKVARVMPTPCSVLMVRPCRSKPAGIPREFCHAVSAHGSADLPTF